MKNGDKMTVTGLAKPIVSTFNYTVLARNNDVVTIISVLADKAIAEYNHKRFTINTKYLK